MTFGKSNCYSVSGIATESMPEKTWAKLCARFYNGIFAFHQGVAEFRDTRPMKLWIKMKPGTWIPVISTPLLLITMAFMQLRGNIDLNIEPTNEYDTFLVTHIHRLEHTNGTSDCWQ